MLLTAAYLALTWLGVGANRRGVTTPRLIAIGVAAGRLCADPRARHRCDPPFVLILLVLALRQRPRSSSAVRAMLAGCATLVAAVAAHRLYTALASPRPEARWGGEVGFVPRDANLREFVSFVWQFYLPRLETMTRASACATASAKSGFRRCSTASARTGSRSREPQSSDPADARRRRLALLARRWEQRAATAARSSSSSPAACLRAAARCLLPRPARRRRPASAAFFEPAPLVTRVRSLTVAKLPSIGSRSAGDAKARPGTRRTPSAASNRDRASPRPWSTRRRTRRESAPAPASVGARRDSIIPCNMLLARGCRRLGQASSTFAIWAPQQRCSAAAGKTSLRAAHASARRRSRAWGSIQATVAQIAQDGGPRVCALAVAVLDCQQLLDAALLTPITTSRHSRSSSPRRPETCTPSTKGTRSAAGAP
jgi:hypothetical protein